MPPDAAQVPGTDARFDLDQVTELIGTGSSLDETLRRIAAYAKSALRGADGVVLRVIDDGGTKACAVAGPEAVRLADEYQFVLGEGPSLNALASRLPSRSGSLGGSQIWRRYGPRAGRLGMHSVLAVPLIVPHRVVGTMTSYARSKNAFGENEIRIAANYALPAAAVIHNAYVLDRSQTQIAQLTEALRVCPVIDRAVGIMMSRTGKSADEALAKLRRMSNVEHVKVGELAQRIVDSAVDRAKRRRSARPVSVDFRASDSAEPTSL